VSYDPHVARRHGQGDLHRGRALDEHVDPHVLHVLPKAFDREKSLARWSSFFATARCRGFFPFEQLMLDVKKAPVVNVEKNVSCVDGVGPMEPVH
jgi:hypothetical protein